MSLLKNNNRKLLFRRFPQVALNTLLTDIDHWNTFYTKEGALTASVLYEEDPLKDSKEWFESLFLKDVEVLYIYGLGLGYYYLACRHWLKEDENRVCVFLEDDPSVIKLFLTSEHAEELLSDTQVILSLFSDKDQTNIVLSLCEYYLYAPFYVTSLKSYKNKSKFKELYQSIYCHSALKVGFANEFYLSSGKTYSKNIYQNLLSLDGVVDGGNLYQKELSTPALICCGGPSLKKMIPFIKQWKNKVVLFSGGSATQMLHKGGITPHFIYSIDPNLEEYRRQFYNPFFETPLCFNLRVYPHVLPLHHSSKIYVSHFIFWKLSLWIENELGMIPSNDCGGLFTTTMCLDLARRMGFQTISCVGMDLSFESDQQEIIKNKTSIYFQRCTQKNVKGEDRLSNWEFTLGKEWLSNYSKIHKKVTFVNITEEGLSIEGFTHSLPANVESDYFSKSIDVCAFIHSLTQRLATVDTSRIKEILQKLLSSFSDCFEYYTQLNNLLSKGLDVYYENNQRIIALYQKELAYRLLLKDQESIITTLLKRKLDLVLSDLQSDKLKKIKAQKHYLENLYGELIKTVDFHKEQIDEKIRRI
jgi:hypothetical protein